MSLLQKCGISLIYLMRCAFKFKALATALALFTNSIDHEKSRHNRQNKQRVRWVASLDGLFIPAPD